MAVGAIIAIVGGVLGAVSSQQKGQASARQSEFEASVSEQQATSQRQVAAAEEADFRRSQDRVLGDRRAALGASGIDPSTGSPLLATGDFAAEVELNALRIREGGELRANRLEQEAVLKRQAGKNAQTGGLFGAGSSLLSGFGKAFG